MSKLQIKNLSLDALLPYINNARTHSEEQINQIASSIKEFGFNNPILLDDSNTIIAGHGRLEAARKLGLTEVPTIQLSHLSKAKKKAYILADNRIALNAGWSPELLKLEFDSLLEDGFDLSLTGFDEDEISAFLNPEVLTDGFTDDDELPAIAQLPISNLGDIWLLGGHRLMCGDSTMLDQVEKLMNGEKAELLFTSPPYSDMREYSGNDLSLDTLTSIFMNFGQDTNYFVINLGIQYKDHQVFEYWNEWIKAARDSGLKLLSWNIWDKIQAGSISNQKQMFALSHEWILVFGEKPKDLNRIWEKSENTEKRQKYFKVNEKGQKLRAVRQADGSMELSSYGRDYDNKNMGSIITTYSEQEREIDHPAKYPVQLPQPYIESMTKPGDGVIDCFGGSGTTLIACEKTSRKCFMMEISPQYCDVIIRRWQKFAQKNAILESTQQSFDEIANERTNIAAR